ncbi:radical SAM protein [Thiohalobacter thiocyanaticus]|uniref:Radical SAM protein n=1 Tax=Thiohalobacter thiocyanaticus TaxID=585455 RepID=A0A1Z4VNS8_9GAMM|nr:TIGR01212 family radical SAM protein [Thiohalobacter thiocyanaticus]BAZ92884.1 radical SAM protein [Thiohalobacter thiocyanaticus]
MALSDYVNTLGRDLLRRHGERVHKLSLHAGFTCPNRDGSKGIGGCSFCNNVSFAPMARERAAVREQIASGRRVIRRRTGARKYIAYFQAYTNTYGELERLKALYDEALAEPDVIGLAIGTRPDCVPDAVLDLLADYRDQGHEVWLELGLQSAFDTTLERVNRGHGWAEYAATLRAARSRGLAVCTHLIIGLPGEARWHARQSLLRVLALGVDGLKLHPLHVVKGTRLANEWRRGEYRPLTQAEYVDIAADLIRVTPPEVVYHRVTATAATRILLAPDWCARKWRVLNAIEAALADRCRVPAISDEVEHGTGLSGG